jgi:LCP family protein required for cell wall assembly
MTDHSSGGRSSRQVTRGAPPGPPRQRRSADGGDSGEGRTRGGARGRSTEAAAQEARPEGGRAAARRAARSQGSRGGGSGHRRAGGRAKPKPRRKRLARTILIVVSSLVLVMAGTGAWLYKHLNGNINSVSIGGGAGQEKADAFGRTPINILVIGSDGRNSAEDCKLGGGCGGGTSTVGHNADVEMVVHISADRSNATVMSIPRDTITDIPDCTDPKTHQSSAAHEGLINSALQLGPECQVDTVHRMTGIPIDHFVQLDFSGVVKMSDAVGGVSVCVDNNVYDTYSHLKLAKGRHTLEGDAALEFVRTRHGFGTGGDLDRTYAQHIFLSAMMQKFKSAGTLANPTKVYGLADAATKALTVDSGLGSVTKLVGLAEDVNKVPTDRMTFTTMQTAPDPNDENRVIIASGAQEMFHTIESDTSLTAASGKKAAKPKASASKKAPPKPATSVDPADVAVSVENGTATSGRAAVVAKALTDKGFVDVTTGNGDPTHTTSITYGSGEKDQALAVAQALGVQASRVSPGDGESAKVDVVIGSDWPTGGEFTGGSSGSPDSSQTKAATANAHAQTAKTSQCASVSTFKTSTVNGVPMTPSEAYAEAKDKPDSAR